MMEQISAENIYTTPFYCEGDLSFDLRGTFVGTVTIQRCPGDDDEMIDANYINLPSGSFDAGTAKTLISPGSYYYRAGFTTGNYTSGTAEMGFRK